MSLAHLVGSVALGLVGAVALAWAVVRLVARRRHEQAGGHGPRGSRVDGLLYFGRRAQELPRTIETHAPLGLVADPERAGRRDQAKERLDVAALEEARARLEREARDQHVLVSDGDDTRWLPFSPGADGAGGSSSAPIPSVTAGGGSGGAGGSARVSAAWEVTTGGPWGPPTIAFKGGLRYRGQNAVDAALGALASGGDASAMMRAARAAVSA